MLKGDGNMGRETEDRQEKERMNIWRRIGSKREAEG